MRETWDFLPPRLKRELLKFEHKDFFAAFPRLNVAGTHQTR